MPATDPPRPDDDPTATPAHELPRSGASLWVHDRPPAPTHAPLAGDATTDVVVVGAGMAGLTAADVLSRAGVGVRVLESRRLGSGATGFTTAKISLLQGSRHHTIARRHGAATVRHYADANREGAEHLRARLDELGLPVEERDAVTYALGRGGLPTVEGELEASRAAGVPVERALQPPDLGVAVAGAVVLPGQAQFDPVPYLGALATAVEAAGGRVHEETRVVAVDRDDRAGDETRFVVRTERGAVRARHVLVCTGMPLVDRGLYFARLEPLRSYCVALRVDGGPPPGLPMAINVDSPTRSLRTAPDPAGGPDLLLVGGEGHVVGREPDTVGRYEALVAWAEAHHPVTEVAWRWSTQDYEAVDELPYVGGGGTLPDGMLVATGFAKWGMTNGAAAGLALADDVRGRPARSWRGAFDAGRGDLARSAGRLVELNAKVAYRMVVDRLAALRPAGTPGEGGATVGALGHTGRACVDGEAHEVSAVCPHLGGVLAWNPAERSWDCPLHGSRFGCDGPVLQGPAVTDLRRRT